MTKSRQPGVLSVPGGFTLLELLLTLLLSGSVLSMGVILLVGTQQVWREMLEVAESGEVRRTVASVLLEELGRGVSGEDWLVDASGVIQLRAFRGEARGCGHVPEDGTILVLRRGERQAEAGRDSVLILDRSGDWMKGALVQVRIGGAADGLNPFPCATRAGERLERWEVLMEAGKLPWLSDEVLAPGPFFLRYFERGQYSLEDRAFRYRRGTAGRQPLTAERVSPSSSFFQDAQGVAVKLVLLPAGSPPQGGAWDWTIPGGRLAFPLRPPRGEP